MALARAIVVQPAVLLLDEPLSNLDANLREEMRYEIRRLHDEFRITTVYVTHDQAEAMVTSDRIAVMNQGRVEQVDEPRALYARPRTRFVAGFIGRTNFLDGEVRGADGRLRRLRHRRRALRGAGRACAARWRSRCGRRASPCTASARRLRARARHRGRVRSSSARIWASTGTTRCARPAARCCCG